MAAVSLVISRGSQRNRTPDHMDEEGTIVAPEVLHPMALLYVLYFVRSFSNQTPSTVLEKATLRRESGDSKSN